MYYKFRYNNPIAEYIKSATEKHVIAKWKAKVETAAISIDSCEETIKNIVDNKKSISRFGDGELRLLRPGEQLYFQDRDELMVSKLREALNSNLPNLIIGLNEGIIQENGLLKQKVKNWWIVYLKDHGLQLIDLLPKNRRYGNANITRFYIDYTDSQYSLRISEMLKNIWNRKDILIVEGEFSRLGVGNDLFENARSLHRILCPVKNAFSRYDEILEACKEYGKEKLLILALGPTATVLAYDLAKEHYWALDMGHVDVEYMWMKMRATGRVSLRGKAVAESKDRDSADYSLSKSDQQEYNSSIVKRIL
ncbi:GT-D fold domain-containing glycosyltransferase [Kaistella daneshvariae]|nr:GT-D fold domain-containing glycosyltransferase [Kaistella daneshvariae]